MVGTGMYGKDHAVRVPVYAGSPLVPKRSRKSLCGIRVMVLSIPWVGQDHERVCILCTRLTSYRKD